MRILTSGVPVSTHHIYIHSHLPQTGSSRRAGGRREKRRLCWDGEPEKTAMKKGRKGLGVVCCLEGWSRERENHHVCPASNRDSEGLLCALPSLGTESGVALCPNPTPEVPTPLHWAEEYPPGAHVHQEPQDVTLFGNHVFADYLVEMRSYGFRVGPESNDWRLYDKRGTTEIYTSTGKKAM